MRKLIPLLLLSLFQVSLIGCSNQSYIKPDLGMASRLAGKAYTEGRCEDAIPHYLEIINLKSLSRPRKFKESFNIFIAYYLNKVRLIDNI